MTVSPVDVRKVRERVEGDLGPPREWAKWSGGWPGDIESALVDAVFSARALYSTKNKKGVLAHVQVWRATRQRNVSNLRALANEIRDEGPEAWAQRFGSSQRSPGRPSTAPYGPLKAATVLQAAEALGSIGILSAEDITESSMDNVKHELMAIPGIGFATTNYFLMLLGRPGVKPDRMIHRFLESACGHVFSDRAAEEAVTAVADELKVLAHHLDHVIWSYESDRARR